jgi:hypothetical protein
MKVIKKAPQDEKWIEMTTAKTKIIRDLPFIFKESNPEVLAKTVAAYVMETDASPQEEAAPVKAKAKKVKGATASETAAEKAKQ